MHQLILMRNSTSSKEFLVVLNFITYQNKQSNKTYTLAKKLSFVFDTQNLGLSYSGRGSLNSPNAKKVKFFKWD